MWDYYDVKLTGNLAIGNTVKKNEVSISSDSLNKKSLNTHPEYFTVVLLINWLSVNADFKNFRTEKMWNHMMLIYAKFILVF